MKLDRRGSGASSYLTALQWIWTLLSSVLPVSVSLGNTAPIWQACSRLGEAPGPHWRPRAWLAVEPPPYLPLLLTLDTACVYLKRGGGAIWKVFVLLWEKGEERGGGLRRKAGWEGAGKGGRPYKYSRGAVNGEREIKQMEFVLKNSTITLFWALQRQKKKKREWPSRSVEATFIQLAGLSSWIYME